MCISTCTRSHLAAPTPYVYVVPPRTTVYRSTTRNTTMDKSCGTPWNTGTSHGNDPFTSPRPPTSSFKLRPFFLSLSSSSTLPRHLASLTLLSHSLFFLSGEIEFKVERSKVISFSELIASCAPSSAIHPSSTSNSVSFVSLTRPAPPSGVDRWRAGFYRPSSCPSFSLLALSFFFFFLENCAFHKLATGGAGGGRREVGRTRDDRWKLVADGFGNRAGTVELEFFEASLD